MKRNIKKIAFVVITLVLALPFFVTAINAENKTIVVGGTSISVDFFDAVSEAYESEGYDVEFQMFDSNPVVLEAVNSGEVDIALGQHKIFMEKFNKDKDGDLKMVKPYAMYTGIGLYSEKHNSVDEIPDGGTIVIMNDAMNGNVALRILEDAGLIKIDENIKDATVADIIENPKNLNIVEVEQAQAVTSLQDSDAATVFFTHMAAAGKDPQSYLVRDSVMVDYPMGPIVKEENAEADWAVKFAEQFRIKEHQEVIAEKYPGVFEFYTSDDQVNENINDASETSEE